MSDEEDELDDDEAEGEGEDDDGFDDDEDGDGDGDGDGDEGGGGRAKIIKLGLIIGLPVLLIIGGLAAAYFMGYLEPLLGDIVASEEDAEPAVLEDVSFFPFPEILVNLNTGGKQTNYLKVKILLEVEDPLLLPQLETLQPRILESFQLYLRELRLEDLNGSAGAYRLKEELLVRVNTALKPGRVSDVLFADLLVQ